MSTEIPAALQAMQKTARKPRKGCEYTVEERLILGQYKDIYRSKTTAGERRSLIQTQILVAIFNYWDSKGIVPDAEETQDRIKTLGRWIANNWRPYKTVKEGQSVRKRSKLDIVWQEMNQACQAEIIALGGNAFASRTPAAKKVYEGLTLDEKRKIDAMAERSAERMNPAEVQRRRADRLGASTVKNWANHQWRDMGMLALTFFAYTGRDGKVAVEVEDRMATNAGKSERRFIDLYPDLVQNLQLKLFDYARLLNSVGAPPDSEHPAATRQQLITLDTEDGYPVMPALGEVSTLKKEDLRDLLRQYLTEQYKLASGFRKSHVPFGQLISHTARFVDPKYLPRRIHFKDPHNMTKEAIVDLCSHIRDRQEAHGVQDAFVFRQYEMKGQMMPAEYGTRADQTKAASRAAKQKASRKARAQNKGRETHDSVVQDRQQTAHPNATTEATPENEQPTRQNSTATSIDHRPRPRQRKATAQHNQRKPSAEEEHRQTRQANPDTEHPAREDTTRTAADHTRQPINPTVSPQLPHEPTQQTPDPDSMIDPALRSHQSPGTQETEAVAPSMATDDTMVVDFTAMELLKSHGYPSAIPFNSPNEGLPLYRVPAAARVILHNSDTTSRTHIPSTGAQGILLDRPPAAPKSTLEKPQERETEPKTSRPVPAGQVTRRQAQIHPNTSHPAFPSRMTRSRARKADTQTVQEGQGLLKRKRSRKRGN